MQDSNQSRVGDLVLTALFCAIVVVLACTPLGYIPLVVINATTIHIPVIIASLYLGPKKGAFVGGVFGLTSLIRGTLIPQPSSFLFSPFVSFQMVGVAGIFESMFIALVPRILIGVVPYFVYKALKKILISDNKKTYGTIVNVVVSALFIFGAKLFIDNLQKINSLAITLVIAIAIGVVVFVIMEYLTLNKSPKALGYISSGIAGSLTNTILVMGAAYLFYKEPYADLCGWAGDAIVAGFLGIISFNGVIEAIVAAIIVYLVLSVLEKVRPIKN